MSYRAFIPDAGSGLVTLARSLGGTVICHRLDLPMLSAAGIAVETLPHGGPLRGELWVAA